jgi:adenosylcobinamide-GDP ribazoletransferase
MGLADAARLAVGTLTVLPVGPVTRVDRATAGAAMLLAPVAVLPLALAAAAAAALVRVLGWPALVGGLVFVAVLALGTRALHLDGLADTVDGLGSGWDRDKALAVMRRGDVGPMGVVALVLVLAAQVGCAAALLRDGWGAVTLAILACASRAALALVCRVGVPAARPDGLGAAVAGSVPRWAAAAVWVAFGIVLALLSEWRGQPWWLGVAAALVALVVVSALVRRCVRRLGGVTGDVMGAAVEAAFTVLVVAAAR